MTLVVDSVRVLRLLRRLTDEVIVLDHERGATDTRRADALWLRGVKYSFVVAIETAVDVAQHLCAGGGWGPPSDNGPAVRLLAEHGVVPPDRAARMSRAVGFRNLLVHDYAVVDDTVVTARLEDLPDLESFARSVARWVQPPA